MKWSIKAGNILGIDIYLHFTFLLLLAFLGFVTWRSTGRIDAAAAGVSFIAALFGCVLLHELGHALMARKLGIKTSNITLLPIGGIARLEKMPEKPMQELLVALAGPAVNLAIAALLFMWLGATRGFTSEELSLESGSVLQRLMTVNLALAAFNLLPAFPMDGGRVLRALLATFLGHRRATSAAAYVGQNMAILFGLFGLLHNNPFLVFIAIFVYLGAQAEAGLVKMQFALKDLLVRDAMMTRFRTLSIQSTLGNAAEELLAGSQQDFPVMANDQSVGILRRNDLVKALISNRRDVTVDKFMCSECDSVDEMAPLQRAVETMQARHSTAMPVTQDGRIVGLLTMDKISDRIMINAALEHNSTISRSGDRSHSYLNGSLSSGFSEPKQPIQPS